MIDKYFSPDEAKRTLSTIVAVLGGIVLFALFAFIVVPGLRNANRPAATPPVATPQGESGWLDPTEYPPAKGYEIPAVRAEELVRATPKLLERGRTLYAQNCASCHGAVGTGDGPAARGLAPPPRNFTRPDGWKNGFHLGGIATTLGKGIPGSSMSPFDFVSKTDRMALAHHVQSLGRFPHGDDPTRIAALARELGSAGETVPPRIPISLAIAKIAGEFRPPATLPPPRSGVDDAALVARAIGDSRRAATWLAALDAWREGPATLAAAAVAGAPANGFRIGAATLSPGEWKRLHPVLLAIVPAPQEKEVER